MSTGQSALEKELASARERLRTFSSNHDRAVVVGFVLCCVPFPPVLLVGLLISGLNYWLWRRRKLALEEGRIIKIALLIGGVLLVLSVVGFYAMWLLVHQSLWPVIDSTLESVRGFFGGRSVERI